MIKRLPLRVAVIGEIVAILVMVLLYNVGGSGFAGKTLWDWLQLLIVPLFLLLGGIVINSTIQRGERERADDRQREQALQTYLDRMSEMLLKNQFDDAEVSGQAKIVARARTLTVLRGLDSGRKSAVIRFLSEAGLVAGDEAPTIDLSTADLRETDLSGAKLKKVNFADANLEKANLQWADFAEANLARAYLSEANLVGTNLKGANLAGSVLVNAALVGSSLDGANLVMANLARAYLVGARLTNAYLAWAHLDGATITPEQLAEAILNENTILPDGSHWKPPAESSQGGSQ